MSSRSLVRSNYIYNILYRLSICILPLVITPYIARVLGADGTGLYSFSSVVACYFIMFSKLGLETYGNRTIAACLDNEELRAKTFWSIYVLQILTSVLSMGIYVSLIYTVFADHKVIYWLQFLYVLSALFDVSWYFYGTEEFRLTTIRSLVVRVLIIVCVFLFVHTEKDLPIYTLIMSAAFLLEQLILFLFVLKIPRVPFTLADVKAHILPNLKLFVPLAALNVFNWTDKLMLGFLVDNHSVAYYTYAENIINLPKGIVAALGTVMLPRIVKLFLTSREEECREAFQKSVVLINSISCALCFGIAAVSSVFVPLFLGNDFLETIHLTIGLAVVMLPMSLIDVIQSQYLVPFQKDRIYIVSVLLGAGVNLVLNAILIPFMAANGAVIGTLGAEFTVFFYQIICIRHFYSGRDVWNSLWPFLICGILEFAIAFHLRTLALPSVLTLLIQIAAGGAVYLTSCAVMLLFVRKDLKTAFYL